jgi:hypothetical protein
MCRRANVQTFWMAEQLGFQVIQARAQFLPPSVDADSVEEVRAGLGYFDLTASLEAHETTVQQLTDILPTVTSARAMNWQASAPVIVDHCQTLRNITLSNLDRDAVMAALRQDADAQLGVRGGW